MKKIETIWHHLLDSAIEQHKYQFTQARLAQDFGYSLSTINLALVKPTAIGAIRKSGKFFVVADPLKLLYLWATVRNLDKDLIFQTYSTLPVHELEGLAPPTAIYGGYSAATLILGEPPADYSTVYLYLDSQDLVEIKLRYPTLKSGPTQIIILQKPPRPPLTPHTSLPHTFVDIWNLRDWYAHDFTLALEDKIHGLLS